MIYILLKTIVDILKSFKKMFTDYGFSRINLDQNYNHSKSSQLSIK